MGAYRWAAGLGIGVWLGGIALMGAAAAGTSNPTIEIGIVQRFGDSTGDRLKVSASGGAHVVLEYDNEAGEEQIRNLPSLTVGISNQYLPEPEQQERLILSNHRSFESAEASALEWQALGVETLTVQPEEWQVWAAPSKYSAEDYERILDLAQSHNRPNVRLDRQMISAEPYLSWTIQGETFSGQNLDIHSSTGSALVVNGSLYGGELTLQPNSFGTYTVVNSVPIETYLRGVVPHEIGPGAPFEAVKAQAILARTYALQNRHRFAPDNYELCADTQCQVYRGLSETVAAADRAIAATASQVLTYEGELVDAVYSSTTGGVTADFTHIWDGEPRPYLQSRPDSLFGNPLRALDLSREDHVRQFLSLRNGFNEAGISNYFRWQLHQPLAKLTRNLRENQKYLGIPMPPYETIAGLEILERSPSGRVQEMRMDLRQSDGTVASVNLRKDSILLGLRATYSLLFTLDPIYTGGTLTGYTFNGGGLGHGVGMSQYGSYHLARRGFSAANILSFYYPGTAVAPLTPEILNGSAGELSKALPAIGQ